MSVCSVKDCRQKYRCTGYCAFHYGRFQRGTDLYQPKMVHDSHGMAGTREYLSWRTMLDRCNNKKVPSYEVYGAKGIKVCNRWLRFVNFYKDMGKRPQGMSLDRINSSGNYEPSNCRWANPTQQAINQRMSIRNTSGYRGVSRGKKGNWRAYISLHKNWYALGTFSTKEEAAKAYDRAAIKLHGEFARLNFVGSYS